MHEPNFSQGRRTDSLKATVGFAVTYHIKRKATSHNVIVYCVKHMQPYKCRCLDYLTLKSISESHSNVHTLQMAPFLHTICIHSSFSMLHVFPSNPSLQLQVKLSGPLFSQSPLFRQGEVWPQTSRSALSSITHIIVQYLMTGHHKTKLPPIILDKVV